MLDGAAITTLLDFGTRQEDTRASRNPQTAFVDYDHSSVWQQLGPPRATAYYQNAWTAPSLPSELPTRNPNSPLMSVTWLDIEHSLSDGSAWISGDQNHTRHTQPSTATQQRSVSCEPGPAADFSPASAHVVARAHARPLDPKQHRQERRREQNRVAQRDFRARKEAKIKEATDRVAVLEDYLRVMKRRCAELLDANNDLRLQLADAGFMEY